MAPSPPFAYLPVFRFLPRRIYGCATSPVPDLFGPSLASQQTVSEHYYCWAPCTLGTCSKAFLSLMVVWQCGHFLPQLCIYVCEYVAFAYSCVANWALRTTLVDTHDYVVSLI